MSGWKLVNAKHLSIFRSTAGMFSSRSLIRGYYPNCQLYANPSVDEMSALRLISHDKGINKPQDSRWIQMSIENFLPF